MDSYVSFEFIGTGGDFDCQVGAFSAVTDETGTTPQDYPLIDFSTVGDVTFSSHIAPYALSQLFIKLSAEFDPSLFEVFVSSLTVCGDQTIELLDT